MGGRADKCNNQNYQYPAATPGDSKQFEKYIQDAFDRAANKEGELTKDKFNETLAVLEDFNIKRLRDTPLGVKLFHIFDEDHNNTVSFKEFSKGLTSMIQNKEARLFYTFKIYDHDNDNLIKRKEFIDLFEESWMTAFRILVERVQNEKNGELNFVLVNNWAKSQKTKVKEYMDGIFTQIDQKKTGWIEFPSFKEWLMKTDLNSITAIYENYKVEIPTSLYAIDADVLK